MSLFRKRQPDADAERFLEGMESAFASGVPLQRQVLEALMGDKLSWDQDGERVQGVATGEIIGAEGGINAGQARFVLSSGRELWEWPLQVAGRGESVSTGRPLLERVAESLGFVAENGDPGSGSADAGTEPEADADDDPFADSIPAMWIAMRTLEPGEFGRFTSLVAREISACVEGLEISTRTDEETLRLVLPMAFARAMGGAPTPGSGELPMPPEPFASFLREAAAACRRTANSVDSGFAFPLALGSQGATAVREGTEEREYVIWAIYRAFLEVLLQTDPLPPETERCALQMFQSGLRVTGLA